MKIEWLDSDMSEAIVTRGVFRKSQARVRWVAKPLSYDADHKVWKYAVSGREVEYDIANSLDEARKQEQKRREHQLDWQPVTPMPQARQVRRG